jgi:hypothetical protein
MEIGHEDALRKCIHGFSDRVACIDDGSPAATWSMDAEARWRAKALRESPIAAAEIQEIEAAPRVWSGQQIVLWPQPSKHWLKELFPNDIRSEVRARFETARTVQPPKSALQRSGFESKRMDPPAKMPLGCWLRKF